jgi:hypothetical protein
LSSDNNYNFKAGLAPAFLLYGKPPTAEDAEDAEGNKEDLEPQRTRRTQRNTKISIEPPRRQRAFKLMLFAMKLLEYLEGMYLAAQNAALSDGSSAVHFKVGPRTGVP